jgi:DNA-binding PadR family transcriptional regulator
MYEVILNKDVRGYILGLAKIPYPYPISSSLIETCLLDAGMPTSPTQIEGHLQYLSERGYITMTKSELEVTGTAVILVTLTAKGIDLLENTTSDPGVHIK